MPTAYDTWKAGLPSQESPGGTQYKVNGRWVDFRSLESEYKNSMSQPSAGGKMASPYADLQGMIATGDLQQRQGANGIEVEIGGKWRTLNAANQWLADNPNSQPGQSPIEQATDLGTQDPFAYEGGSTLDPGGYASVSTPSGGGGGGYASTSAPAPSGGDTVTVPPTGGGGTFDDVTGTPIDDPYADDPYIGSDEADDPSDDTTSVDPFDIGAMSDLDPEGELYSRLTGAIEEAGTATKGDVAGALDFDIPGLSEFLGSLSGAEGGGGEAGEFPTSTGDIPDYIPTTTDEWADWYANNLAGGGTPGGTEVVDWIRNQLSLGGDAGKYASTVGSPPGTGSPGAPGAGGSGGAGAGAGGAVGAIVDFISGAYGDIGGTLSEAERETYESGIRDVQESVGEFQKTIQKGTPYRDIGGSALDRMISYEDQGGGAVSPTLSTEDIGLAEGMGAKNLYGTLKQFGINPRQRGAVDPITGETKTIDIGSPLADKAFTEYEDLSGVAREQNVIGMAQDLTSAGRGAFSTAAGSAGSRMANIMALGSAGRAGMTNTAMSQAEASQLRTAMPFAAAGRVATDYGKLYGAGALGGGGRPGGTSGFTNEAEDSFTGF